MSFLTLPELTIEVDGAPLATAALSALTSVRVRQQLSLPSGCELLFSEPPGPIAAAMHITPGARLRVRVTGHTQPLFVGQVTTRQLIYHPGAQQAVRVRAYDLMHALRKRQAVRTHVQLTARELVEELVRDLGLTVESAESGPLHPYLIQHSQSDFDFLSEILERCGLYFSLRDSSLHLLTLDGLDDNLELRLGENLLEARAELNADRAASTVTAQGWNPLLMETFESTRRDGRSGRRVSAEVTPASVNGGGDIWLVDEDMADPDQVEAFAQAEFDHRLAAIISLWGVARGDPALQPGTRVEVQGLAEDSAGRYVVTEVTHTIDTRLGFVSEFSTTPPPIPDRPRSAIVTLGVVTQVDDPDQMGRVRVKLPTYNNVETDWLQVVSPAAGTNKGLVALPGVEDNVLVLFARHNPSQSIIVGGIYGPYAPYDPGVAGSAVRRYSLRTPDGHFIRLDDEHRSLRVEDSHGNYMEMTPDKVRVFANTDLEISAPGRAIVIRGSRIDFQTA